MSTALWQAVLMPSGVGDPMHVEKFIVGTWEILGLPKVSTWGYTMKPKSQVVQSTQEVGRDHSTEEINEQNR